MWEIIKINRNKSNIDKINIGYKEANKKSYIRVLILVIAKEINHNNFNIYFEIVVL